MSIDRDKLLAMEDEELLRHCEMTAYRASGPGGQHRNTTDSAVRLTVPDSAIVATAAEHRSQHQNRKLALRRLRLEIALNLRSDQPRRWAGAEKLGKKDPRYARWTAIVFDALEQHEFRVGEAADQLDLSTGRLIRWLADDTTVWAAANRGRERFGHHPLNMP